MPSPRSGPRTASGPSPAAQRDRYESDAACRTAPATVYRELAATGWLAPWTVLDGAADVDPGTLADDLLR